MLNSEFVHCMRTTFNPFMQNGISHPYQLKQSISFEYLQHMLWLRNKAKIIFSYILLSGGLIDPCKDGY